jgi:hypothetical protein
VFGWVFCVGDEMMSGTQRAALMAAEGAFRRYTHHHITKNDGEKAKANYALADMMAAALAEPEPQCKWPTCHSEEYQQQLADDVARDLIGPQRREPPTDEQIDTEHDKLFPAPIIPGAREAVRKFARAIHGIGAKP